MTVPSRVHFSTLLACAALISPPVLADTLAGALARAVANLPEVRAARANRSAIEENVAQARAAWYPTLDTSIGQGRETSNNTVTRALGSDQTLTRREAEVNLSQLVFDGDATSGQVRRFQARAESANDQVANAAENAGLRVALAYLDVMRLRELIELARENEKRHQETLAQVSRLADVGQGRRADAQQAEARYALAQASLSQLRGQLAQADAAFLHLTGQPPGALAAAGSFQAKLPVSLSAAVTQALETHPAIRAAQKDLLAAQADRDSIRSRLVAPRLVVEIGQSSNHELDGVRGLSADRFAMLRLRYNLFRGGSDNSRVREAQARVDEALANYAKARNDAQRDLRQAWEGLEQDRVRLPQLRRYAAASTQVVSSYRAQFTIGQRTLLDVLNAENELFSARSNQSVGLYTVTAGELRVLAALGNLLQSLGVDFDAVPQTGKQAKDEDKPAAAQRAAEHAESARREEPAVNEVQIESNKVAALRIQTAAPMREPQSAGSAAAMTLRMSMTLGSREAAR